MDPTARTTWTTPAGVWAQEAGDGPLVALVHGSMDRSGGMLRLRRLLQPGHRVLRYDRRGYARSLPAGPPASFDEQVDDLAELLGARPALLLGHSFGGLVCLGLAQRRPDLVEAVVSYEAPTMWAAWWPGSVPLTPGADAEASGDGLDGHGEEAAEWFLRRMIGDEMWERLPAAMRAERRAEGPTLVAEMRSVRPPAPPPFDPAAVAVPVVVARGSEARPHHRRAADELAAALPRAERHTVAGAAHGAHLTHPAELATLVARAAFLAGRDASRTAGGERW
jgi:pimeloyl-ACP methyl ester carboxylesterase